MIYKSKAIDHVNDEILPRIILCENVLDFLDKVQHFSRRGWIYRGHGRTTLTADELDPYRLESTLWRYLKVHTPKILKPSWYPREKTSLARFQKVAHLHLSHLPGEKDQLTWLALMQHYGAPTRLIDFTYNPAVALFFALRDARPSGDPWGVHAVHVETVRGRTFTIRQNATSKTPSRWPAPTEYAIGTKPISDSFIGVFDGRLVSARQEAQEGAFLVPNRIDLNVEAWLSSIKPNKSAKPYRTHWVKFVFENTRPKYYAAIKSLMQMGMSPVRLFPGLEGLCESFRFTWLDIAKDFEPGEEM